MPRPSAALASSARQIISACETISEASPPILEVVNGELARSAGAELSIAWGFSVRERVEIDFLYQTGMPRTFETMLLEHLKATPGPFGNFHPARPERWQQNRVLSLREVERRLPKREPAPVVRDLYPRLDIKDHYRVLVCDREALLAYVGVVHKRSDRAPPMDKWLLGAVLPALRHRLTIERLVGLSSMWMTALAAALEHVPSAAAIVSQTGCIRYANSAAKRWFDTDRGEIAQALRDSVRGRSGAFHVTKLAGRGVPVHWLAVRAAPREEGRARAEAAAARWALTVRQRAVLQLLVTGMANKTIAATLGSAENTVELHVGAILRKAQVSNRAELIAKVWSRS